MTRFYSKNNHITLYQQLYALQTNFPASNGHIKRNCLYWIGAIKPTPFGRNYTIKITYNLGKSPRIFVLKPSLKKLADGRMIPHLYSQEEEQLCLYQPKYTEWNKTMKISNTIIPWAFCWLFYFEEWLISDEWKGGGEHP